MIRAPYQDPDWPTRIFSWLFLETRQRASVWQQAVTESCSWINIGRAMSRRASEATKNAFSARAIGPQNSGAKRTAGPRENNFFCYIHLFQQTIQSIKFVSAFVSTTESFLAESRSFVSTFVSDHPDFLKNIHLLKDEPVTTRQPKITTSFRISGRWPSGYQSCLASSGISVAHLTQKKRSFFFEDPKCKSCQPVFYFYQKQKFAELKRIAFFLFLVVKVIIFFTSTYFKSDVRFFIHGKFIRTIHLRESSSNKISFAAEASLAVSIELMGLWSAEDDAWSGGDIFWRRTKKIPQRGLGTPIFLIYFWYFLESLLFFWGVYPF